MGIAYQPKPTEENLGAFVCGKKVNLSGSDLYIIGPDGTFDSRIYEIVEELRRRPDITLIERRHRVFS
jgi:hypothetical protein